MDKFDIKALNNITQGNIIYFIDIFENGYEILRNHNYNDERILFPENWKGRAVLIYANKLNMFYGFELRTNKPKHKFFVELTKTDNSKTYVDCTKFRNFKWEAVISNNEISDTFQLSRQGLKDVVREIFNEFIKYNFRR